jgi:hypothetical protein
MRRALNTGVNENTRIALALVALVFVVLVVLAALVGTVVYASQPGNAGAMLGAFLVAAVGWGFVQEARNALANAVA